VQEHRFGIPRIKEFLDDERFAFLGFELHAGAMQGYRARYPNDQATTDLECWDAFEREHPTTFGDMYQFWCQRG